MWYNRLYERYPAGASMTRDERAREAHDRDIKEIRDLIKKITPAKVRALRERLKEAKRKKGKKTGAR